MLLSALWLSLAIAPAPPAPPRDRTAPAAVRLGGGGPLGPAHGEHQDCIPPAERAKVEARIAANRAALGLEVGSFIPFAVTSVGEGGIAGGDPFDALLYRFWPQSGTLFTDLIPLWYVDVDPTHGAVHDYACHPFAYDGHAGIDTPLHSFEEKNIGVPVYAALDGIVIDRHDGEPDEIITGVGDANYVIIDHGLGRETWYFHLKTNSVTVNVGEVVTATGGCEMIRHGRRADRSHRFERLQLRTAPSL